jgi:hypothetical protein
MRAGNALPTFNFDNSTERQGFPIPLLDGNLTSLHQRNKVLLTKIHTIIDGFTTSTKYEAADDNTTIGLVDTSGGEQKASSNNTNNVIDSTDAADGTIAPPKDFECAIFWLRIPKTASTTIANTFIRPLFKEGNFTSIELGSNSCITGVGGCATFWNGQHIAGTNHSLAPPYGRKRIQSEQTSKYNQRCFPSPEIDRTTFCHEYDSETSTLNFGPDRHDAELPSKVQAHFDAARITTHVGLDPSLFGWILPPNLMVFSTFRDPLERIFSAFHYGIQFGGGRPGSVDKCNLPGANGPVEWGKRVTKAREIAALENNTAPYQKLMRSYLEDCHLANNNTYVQFLDPDTKDVNVAKQNLEDYVIVGLQNKISETLIRWATIARRSCRGHKHYQRMKNVFDYVNNITADGEVQKFRESPRELNDAHEIARRRLSITQQSNDTDYHDESLNVNNKRETTGTNLISPDFNTLDEDLKETITRFTEEDQKVWKRALELYEMQREWGRQ